MRAMSLRKSPESTSKKFWSRVTFGLCASYGFILSYLISLGILSQIKLLIPLFAILTGIGVFGSVYAFYRQKSLGVAFDSVYKGLAVGSGIFTVFFVMYQFFF